MEGVQSSINNHGAARLCYVVAAPMTAQAFLAGFMRAAAQTNEVHLVAAGIDSHWTESARLPVVGHDIAIERKISPIRDLCALWDLYWLFRRERYDVVHSVSPKAGLLAMLAARLAGVPIRIHTFTGQVWANRRGIARTLFRCVDRLIAVLATSVLIDGRSQREFLIVENVVSPDRADVLASGSISGVDLERFRPDRAMRGKLRAELGVGVDDVLFMYLGRLVRDKGIAELLEAFAVCAAERPDVFLLLVGPDEEGMAPAVENLARRHPGRVFLRGYTAAPESLLPAADVFVLPSHREGFGTSVIEAAACGVPAIVANVYGLRDAIVGGKTGLFHTVGDPLSLAGAMRALAADPALRGQLGDGARARVENEFSAGQLVDAQLEHYAILFARWRAAKRKGAADSIGGPE